jgi:hypothetical protein
MNRMRIILIAASGLAVVSALATLTLTSFAASASTRYPGAARESENGENVSLKEGVLNRQASYWTVDDYTLVVDWYAGRLRVPSGSDGNGLAADNCAWFTYAKQALIFNRTVSVLVCALARGTTIFVNENFHLWP